MNKKTAMIVGGATNLGGYLSSLLSQHYKIIIIDINKELAIKKAKEIGNNTIWFEADVSKKDQIIKIFDEIENQKIKINLMVYVAGYAKSDNIVDQKFSDLKLTYGVNLYGYAIFAKYIAKNMISNKIKGFIININSLVGKKGSPNNSAYCSAKWAAIGLTKSIALDLAQHHINVNALCVGHLLDSKMFENLIPAKAQALNVKESDIKEIYKNKNPLKRGCSYNDVYKAIRFYGSEQASYITGQAINVTGGEIMW